MRQAERFFEAHSECGSSIVEWSVAALLLMTILTSLLTLVFSSREAVLDCAARTRATGIARDFIDEIRTRSWEDPDGSPGLGRDRGERLHDRTQWDDIDDYDGLGPLDPPTDADGRPRTEESGFSVSVRVESVDWSAPERVRAPGTTDCKRVTVRVSWSQPDAGSVSLSTLRVRQP